MCRKKQSGIIFWSCLECKKTDLVLESLSLVPFSYMKVINIIKIIKIRRLSVKMMRFWVFFSNGDLEFCVENERKEKYLRCFHESVVQQNNLCVFGRCCRKGERRENKKESIFLYIYHIGRSVVLFWASVFKIILCFCVTWGRKVSFEMHKCICLERLWRFSSVWDSWNFMHKL